MNKERNPLGEKGTGTSFVLSTVNAWTMRSRDLGKTGIVTVAGIN